MNLMDMFSPVPGFILPAGVNNERLGDNIRYFSNVGSFPETEQAEILLLGLGDFDNPQMPDNSVPDELRKHLYRLYKGHYQPEILDAGNISFDNLEEYETVEDRVIKALGWASDQAKMVIILGTSQKCSYYIHELYRQRNSYFNLAVLDSALDMEEEEGDLTNGNWLSKILFERFNKLFNVSLLGYQNYLVSAKIIQGFIDLNFDVMRIGEIRQEIEESEPYLRDADVVSVDASVMQFSSCPSALDLLPNGMRGEELCRLARYMGMSPKLKMCGFFNIDAQSPYFSLGADAMAQVIWHVIDGYYSRTVDSLDFSSNEYLSYEVTSDRDEHLYFYRNRVSGRWWLRIPLDADMQAEYKETEFVVPCSEKDYLAATRNEVPERWLHSLKKLNL